jgi:hypothetical protein
MPQLWATPATQKTRGLELWSLAIIDYVLIRFNFRAFFGNILRMITARAMFKKAFDSSSKGEYFHVFKIFLG